MSTNLAYPVLVSINQVPVKADRLETGAFVDCGSELDICGKTMLNHLRKKYLKNFLHKAPEPLKTVGWGGTLWTLYHLVVLNVEFSGGCYQMAF